MAQRAGGRQQAIDAEQRSGHPADALVIQGALPSQTNLRWPGAAIRAAHASDMGAASPVVAEEDFARAADATEA